MDLLKLFSEKYFESEEAARTRAAKKILHFRKPLKEHLKNTWKLDIYLICVMVAIVGIVFEIGDNALIEGVLTGAGLGIMFVTLTNVALQISHLVALRPEYDWAEKYREE